MDYGRHIPSAPYNSFVSSASSVCSTDMSQVTTPVKKTEGMRMCQSVSKSSAQRSRMYGSVRGTTPMGIRTVLAVKPTRMPVARKLENSFKQVQHRCLTNGSLNASLMTSSSLNTTYTVGNRSNMLNTTDQSHVSSDQSSVYSSTYSSSVSSKSSMYSSSYTSSCRKSSAKRSSSICARKCRVKRACSKQTVSTDSGVDDRSSNASYNSSRRSSKRSILDSTLGPRPECTGQESGSPLLYRFLKDVEISLSQLNTTMDTTAYSDDSTPVNTTKPCLIDPQMYMIKRPASETVQAKLDFTGLDSDWDKSELDATCTTCRSDYLPNSTASVSVNSSCVDYSMSSYMGNSTAFTSSSVYSTYRPSSETSVLLQTMDHTYSEISSIRSDYKSVSNKRNVTATSDLTQFMDIPMNKVSVAVSKDKKKSIGKKLKQMGKYLHRLGGKSSKNTKFTTLAIL